MIDLRAQKFSRIECLVNQQYAQAYDSAADNMDTMIGSNNGVRASPNFFELDPTEASTSPFNTKMISEGNGTLNLLDDQAETTFDLDNSDYLFPSVCDNAVDPEMYINRNTASQQQAVSSNPLRADTTDYPLNHQPEPNVQLPPSYDNHAPPSLARQYSLNRALEVLQSCAAEDPALPPANQHESYYPLTPSPQVEDNYLLHPSPSYIAQEIPFTRQRSHTVSDCQFLHPIEVAGESRSRNYSADLVLGQNAMVRDMQYNACPMHFQQVFATDAGSPDSNADEIPANTADATSTEAVDDAPSLESLPSFVRDSIKDSKPLSTVYEDSLDVAGMLDEFLTSSDPVATKEVETTAPANVVDLTDAEPSTSAPPMARSSSYKRKRDQNNRACRESRKKRKLKQTDLEKTAENLEHENKVLREKIKSLQVEVEATHSLLVSRMSAGMMAKR